VAAERSAAALERVLGVSLAELDVGWRASVEAACENGVGRRRDSSRGCGPWRPFSLGMGVVAALTWRSWGFYIPLNI
jgi:hypothetical protein